MNATVPADDPRVQWVGRTVRPASSIGGNALQAGAREPGDVAFDWEGTSFTVRLTKATSLWARVRLAPGVALELRVNTVGSPPDSVARVRLIGPPAPAGAVPPLSDFLLCEGLNATASHVDVRVVSAVEPMHMYSSLTKGAVAAPPAFAVLLCDGAFASPPPPSSRTLMVIGDSITSGSGAIGVPPCAGDINTTDVTVAYGSLLAGHFDAQLLGNIAVSGIGVLTNCCDDAATMATRAHTWLGLESGTVEDFDWNSPTRPQAVVIGLGTNDFYRHNASNATFVNAFVEAYTSFVVDLALNRLSNGTTAIFLGVGPITDVYLPAVTRVVAATRAMSLPVHVINFMGAALDGCGGHPGVQGHAQMAASAQPLIAAAMRWTVDSAAPDDIAAVGEGEMARRGVSAALAIADGTSRRRAESDDLLRHSLLRGPDINLTVRSDGSGDFVSVGTALAFCNASGDASALGHVTLRLRGVFYERVEVSALFPSGVTLIGEGATPDDALIIFDRGGAEYSTWWAHTMRVAAPDVSLINIAVANNASNYDSTIAGQAPALSIAPTADRFACFGCALYGAQDTLYTGPAGYGLRSYFSEAFINGSCDSIFGGSSSYFDRAVLRMSTTVTAPRGDPGSAYVFADAQLSGPSAILLGRPWGQLSAVVFKNTSMGAVVEPAGWDDWGHGCTSGTSEWCAALTFAEFASGGPGGNGSKRVRWSQQLTPQQAAEWNMTRVLRNWNPVR